ncbi:phage tail protein [Clostridium sp.]|uniref:phage tail protein n=1 Tax=Clostridium sp. TaxID=1506 RepID=UPI00284B5432|nr:phage tail protein [Clostridium sp.]MDR3595696.1 phage tail protein [Clostridium sp.]
MIKKLTLSLLLVVSVFGGISSGASAKWKTDKNNNVSWEENGVKSKGWKLIEGQWYNFGDNGVMTKGWKQDGGNWYYFWSNGTMASSTWLTNGGFWYYFDASGKLVYDSAIVQNRKYNITPAFIISEDLNNASQTNSDTKK